MQNIFIDILPPWVETGLQPAFYDLESGTVLQQTARMYAKVRELTEGFNTFTTNVANEINRFETETNNEIERFENATDAEIERFENSTDAEIKRFENATDAEIERFEGVINATVETYIQKFNDLHDYVEDYFDNLDVQAEINNKLDAMTEDGTLQEIIAAYLNSKAVFGFDTVSDMKQATNFVDGSYAKTLGYHTKNDGGSATYKIRNKTNDDVVDEKFIIEITGDPLNHLIAELVHDEEVNVLTIGADNTNFSDCVNYLISKGLGVYIPKGEYTALSSININQDNTQLTCDGDITFEQDDVLFKVTSYRNMIKLNGNYIGNETDDCTFMKLGIDKTVIANNIFIHNVSKFGTGIELNTSTVKGIAYCKFDFDYLSVSKYGILFNQGAGANFINENYFEGGCIGTTKSSTIGIKFIKGADQTDAYNGNVFEHICIEGHYDCGIKLEYAYYNHFENFRLNEGLVGSYYIDLSDCRYNYFSSKSPTKVSKIRDSETDGNAVNYFNILGCDNSFLRIANKFKTVKNKFVAQASDSVNGYANTQMSFAYNSTTKITEPAIFLNGGTVVTISHDDSSSTLEYTFPEIFGDNGMTSFYLKFGYFSAGDTPVLKDSTGGTIADRTQLGTGALSNHWYKIDFVGSIIGNRWVVTPLSH